MFVNCREREVFEEVTGDEQAKTADWSAASEEAEKKETGTEEDTTEEPR